MTLLLALARRVEAAFHEVRILRHPEAEDPVDQRRKDIGSERALRHRCGTGRALAAQTPRRCGHDFNAGDFVFFF